MTEELGILVPSMLYHSLVMGHFRAATGTVIDF